MRGFVVFAAMAALSACGAPGLKIEIRSGSPSVAGREAEVGRLAEDAARWWGGGPSHLEGWTLILSDGTPDGCTAGCCVFPERAIFIDARLILSGDGGDATLRWLVWHEVGHVLLDALRWDRDPEHRDPRWARL